MIYFFSLSLIYPLIACVAPTDDPKKKLKLTAGHQHRTVRVTFCAWPGTYIRMHTSLCSHGARGMGDVCMEAPEGIYRPHAYSTREDRIYVRCTHRSKRRTGCIAGRIGRRGALKTMGADSSRPPVGPNVANTTESTHRGGTTWSSRCEYRDAAPPAAAVARADPCRDA